MKKPKTVNRPKTELDELAERIASIVPRLQDIEGPEDVNVKHVALMAYALDVRVTAEITPLSQWTDPVV